MSTSKTAELLRFLANVYPDRKTGCWWWIGGHSHRHYADTMVSGKRQMVHRVAYEWFREKIPDRMEAHHTCGCRRCVNPLHLKLIAKSDHARITYAESSAQASRVIPDVANRPKGSLERAVISFVRRIKFGKRKDDCWIWEGPLFNGYGKANLPGHGQINAPRVAYMLFGGDIPRRHHIHHLCENPSCVNPEHLLPVPPEVHVSQFTTRSFAYQNLHKTHCRGGHAFTQENTYINRAGSRCCRTCLRLRGNQRYAAKRGGVVVPRRGKQTMCPQGHPYDEENTYWWRGIRRCRICMKAQHDKFKANNPHYMRDYKRARRRAQESS